jgi:hypothetical protein
MTAEATARAMLAEGVPQREIHRKTGVPRATLYGWAKSVPKPLDEPRRHFIIPDRQNKPGVPLEHNLWIGKMIAKYKPHVVIDMGDGADFESISRHSEPGSLEQEGRRLKADIDAYNTAEALLRKGMGRFKPERMVRLRGNHEDRMSRYINKHPELEGLVGLHLLDDRDWQIVPYFAGSPGQIDIDGVLYAHYFTLPNNGNAVTGTIATRIARVGQSFVQGHSQGLMRGDVQHASGRMAYGVVAGSCYIHDESYKGAANAHWRGVVVLNDVSNGTFDDMPLKLDYLCRKATGKTISRYLRDKYENAAQRFTLARDS